MSTATVGIPKSLLYFKYFPLWESFFTELGADILVSSPSSTATLESGSRMAHSDACVPIKLAFGHVDEIVGKSDFIFLPRFLRLEEKSYVCPKVIGFTDMAKCMMPGLVAQSGPRVIESLFDVHICSDKNVFRKIGYNFSYNPFKIDRAYAKSVAHFKSINEARVGAFEKFSTAGEYRRRIGVVGHPYNIGDDFVSMGVLSELKKRDALPVVSEDIPLHLHECDFSEFPSNLFWSFGREIYKTAKLLMKNDKYKVDGLVYVAPFGCGLDSIMMSIVQSEAKKAGVPFLPLTVDEHTAKAGIVTRIEAFLDML